MPAAIDQLQQAPHLAHQDQEHHADIPSIIAGSAALHISNVPWAGPIGAVRVGLIDGQFIANPTHSQMLESDLDLVYACTRDLPIMIEGGLHETQTHFGP